VSDHITEVGRSIVAKMTAAAPAPPEATAAVTAAVS
jgi:hypothetical protein